MALAIHAGDTVLHKPTGEHWYVLGVNETAGRICVAGWPPTIADLNDCELSERGNGISEDEKTYRQRQFGMSWYD